MARPHVVFAATENDTVYALDANDRLRARGTTGVLWQTSFIDPANGVTAVPFQDVEVGDIRPTLGITGTPVISRATNTLYVVSRVKQTADRRGGPHYVTKFTPWTWPAGVRITAARSRSATRRSTPTAASPTRPRSPYPGPAQGRTRRDRVQRAAREQPARPGARHQGGGTSRRRHLRGLWDRKANFDSYHGWLVGFDAKTLKMVTVFNTDPNGDFGAIWQAGASRRSPPTVI